MKLDIPCDDAKSRLLLEDFKVSCTKGWYFETLRWTDSGAMVYKFFLLDLAEQHEIDGKKYVRYHGWLEASEVPGMIVVKAAGELEKFVDPDLQRELIQRFYDDVVEPVCRRHRVSPRLQEISHL